MADDLPASDLYERDFYRWTQAQARALKARAGGANALDYEHLAEEVGDLGEAERNALRSALRNIIVHLMLLETSRADLPRRYWKVEIANFRLAAEAHITGALRNLARRELEMLHIKAAKLAQLKLATEEAGGKIDAARRWTLAELLGERDDPLDRL